MTTFLLRHATTAYSVRHLVNGDPAVDLPLDGDGVRACGALHVARSFQGARTWITSGFQRAHQTARLLLRDPGTVIHSDPRLNELDYGRFEGGPFIDYAAWLQSNGPWACPPGSAESQHGAVERMLQGVRGALARPGPRVVVAHGLLLSVLRWALSQPPGSAMPIFFPEAGCLDPLVVSDARLSRLLTRLSDDLHLYGRHEGLTGGDGWQSGQGVAPFLATFDLLPNPPEERPPHA